MNEITFHKKFSRKNYLIFFIIKGLKKKTLAIANQNGCKNLNFSEIKKFFQKKLICELETGQSFNHLRFFENVMRRLNKIELLDLTSNRYYLIDEV